MYFFFAPNGQVVAHPNEDLLLTTNVKDFEFGPKMMSMESGLLHYSYDGRNKIGAILRDKNSGWSIVVSAGTDETFAAANRIRYYSILLAVGLVLVLIGGISFFMGRLITKPLGKAVFVMEKLSQGNLRHRLNIEATDEIGVLSNAIDGFTGNQAEFAGLMREIGSGNLTKDVPLRSEEDEISPAVQQMLQNLRDILGEVNQTAHRISAGVNEISDSSQALSQGASEQAASLEEITSSMTEVGSQTNTNAENAGQANKLAVLARMKRKAETPECRT